MADQQEETAAAAPPDTPTGHGSEIGEFDEHGKAIGSSFPELWGVSSPESNDDEHVGDTDEVLSPDTAVTSEEVAHEEAPPEEAKAQQEEESPTDSKPDSSFKVSDLRQTWKQKEQTTTTKRSQLLNLNDFHMQQRQYRVGDKLKKGEAAEHLHSFRNHDAPTKSQKDSAPLAKQPAPEQTKAADRAAMAQYLFLRQSMEKEGRPAAGATHRTLSLRNPTQELAPSKSGDDSVSSTSSSKGSLSKWRKSPTSGKNVIVTDVDEFYAQQHALHLENERKKREILHISDNKEVSPDMLSSLPPPGYTKSMIPALADSVDEEDVILAMASSSNLTDDSNAGPGEYGAFPRDLTADFNTKQSECSTVDEMEVEVVEKESSYATEQVDHVDAKEGGVGRGVEAGFSEETKPEDQQDIISPEKPSEENVAGSTHQAIVETSTEVQNLVASSLTPGQTSSDCGSEGDKGSTATAKVPDKEGKDEESAVKETSGDTVIHKNDTTIEVQAGDSTEEDAVDVGDEIKEDFPASDDSKIDTSEKPAFEIGHSEICGEQGVEVVTTFEKVTLDAESDASAKSVEDIQRTEDEELPPEVSAETSSGDVPTVAGDQMVTNESVEENSNDEIESASRPQEQPHPNDSMQAIPQPSVDLAVENGNKGGEDSCNLIDEFVVVDAEDTEGWDSKETISRSTLISEDSTPGDAVIAEKEAGVEIAILNPGEDGSAEVSDSHQILVEVEAKQSILEIGSEQGETLDRLQQEGIKEAKDQPAIERETIEQKFSSVDGVNAVWDPAEGNQPTAELIDHVPDDVSNVSTENDDSTATVDGDQSTDVRVEDIDLEVAAVRPALKDPTAELVDHVPDDVSNVSEDNDDSTATVDGDKASDVRDADIDLEVVGLVPEPALEVPSADPVDHVPDDVSNVSTDNDDSDATVDGDTPSTARDADNDLVVAAARPALKEPTTELVDNVPGDVFNVPGDVFNVPADNDDPTATVDGDKASNVRDADIDLEVLGLIPEPALEVPSTEPVDHVPGDVSNVSTNNADSTATVDGDTSSAARDADNDLAVAVLESALNEPAVELVDHLPEDISTVSTGNDDSTATVNGDEASAGAATDDATGQAHTNGPAGAFGDVSTTEREVEDSGVLKREPKPWDEGDELMAARRSEVGVERSSLIEDKEETPRNSTIGDSEDTLPMGTLQEGVVEASEADERVDEEVSLSHEEATPGREVEDIAPESDNNVKGAREEDASDDDAVLDALLVSHHAQEIDASADVDEGVGVPESDNDMKVAREEDASDDDAVLDALLVSDHAQELDASAGVDEGVDDVKVPADPDANTDSKNEVFSQDKAVLDVLLASRDDTTIQPSSEGNNDGDVSQVIKTTRKAEVVSEDHPADTPASATEELVASSDIPSNQSRTENNDNESGDVHEVEPEQAANFDHGAPPQPASDEVPIEETTTKLIKEQDIANEGDAKNDSGEESDSASHLIENVLADESCFDVYEETTEGDTSGYHSPQHTAGLLQGTADHTDAKDVSAVFSASSKDSDDASPSEVVATLVDSSPSDESVDELMNKGPKATGSQESLAAYTDSSEDGKPESHSCALSAGSTEKPAASNPGAKVEVDYKSVDYRGFIFVVHKSYGLMLLHCTRKKKKGPHFQLPGGHIDEFEFFAAAEESRDPQTQLLVASRAGAARELYEETGLDVRYQLDRLEPAALRNDVELDKHGRSVLKNELKHRLYFFLPVTDDDFWSSDKGDSDAGKMHPMGAALGCEGSQLMLRLSVEHQGWTFEKDPNKSAQMLAVHSGGQGAIALRMSMARGASGLEDTKPSAEEKAAAEEQTNKELQSETWETEPLVKDEATSPSSQVVSRAAPDDLLPPPEASGLMKLFNCCPSWFNHEDD